MSRVSARMPRGCYEETSPAEFQLFPGRSDLIELHSFMTVDYVYSGATVSHRLSAEGRNSDQLVYRSC